MDFVQIDTADGTHRATQVDILDECYVTVAAPSSLLVCTSVSAAAQMQPGKAGGGGGGGAGQVSFGSLLAEASHLTMNGSRSDPIPTRHRWPRPAMLEPPGMVPSTATWLLHGGRVLLGGLTPLAVANSWLLGTAVFAAFGWRGYIIVCLYFLAGSAVRPWPARSPGQFTAALGSACTPTPRTRRCIALPVLRLLDVVMEFPVRALRSVTLPLCGICPAEWRGVHLIVGGQATRVKLKQKQAEGIAEARSGRRSVVSGRAFVLWPACCIPLLTSGSPISPARFAPVLLCDDDDGGIDCVGRSCRTEARSDAGCRAQCRAASGVRGPPASPVQRWR